MKREAMLTRRLAACGATAFAKTCGFFAFPPSLQDEAGRWRRPGSWARGATHVLRQRPGGAEDLAPFDAADDDGGRRAHCADCAYWDYDSRGAYLKTDAPRAHIRLCPRECVVMQLQVLTCDHCFLVRLLCSRLTPGDSCPLHITFLCC